MKIRLAFLHVLLALLLLVSQQLGVAHAVSHISDPFHASSQSKQLPPEKSCDQCLAFAQIGSALASPPIVFFTDVPADAALSSITDTHYLPATVYAFRSRAPPTLA